MSETLRIWWCEKHRSGRYLSNGSPEPETCDTYQAVCQRIGKNPFHPRVCRIVRADVTVR